MINYLKGRPSKFNVNGMGKCWPLYGVKSKICFLSGFLRFCFFSSFFSFLSILDTKKIGFSSVIFNIKKSSVSPFGSVDRLDTNSRRVFSEKRETIRYKMHHFSTKKQEKQGKNWKNRGKKHLKNRKNREKTGKTGEKNTKKQEKKEENYKKYRNEFSTSFWEMLKTETSSETSLETSFETSSRSSQMSRNDDSRAKTIYRPTPTWDCQAWGQQ